MQKIHASAPAKLLLFGEHAVVYGIPCLATALDGLRMHVAITSDSVHSAIEFESYISHESTLPFRHTLPYSVIEIITAEVMDDINYLPRPTDELRVAMLEQLQNGSSVYVNILLPVYFLCCAYLRSSKLLSSAEGLLIQARPDKNFPIGAGLGSSAAFCVALSAALSRLNLVTDLNVINAYAYAAETLIHGTPSGVDNTISTFGGTLLYQNQPSSSYENIDNCVEQFRFIVIDTNISRSTKVLVQKVKEFYQSHKTIATNLFTEIKSVVSDFQRQIECNKLTETTFANCIGRNQFILGQLPINHPKIDQILSLCKEFQVVCKITGAGGGGCVFGLISRDMDGNALSALVRKLSDINCKCILSNIGGRGVLYD